MLNSDLLQQLGSTVAETRVARVPATQRVAAAVAAGGKIVDNSNAPWFTVIADQDGNRACVCTS